MTVNRLRRRRWFPALLIIPLLAGALLVTGPSAPSLAQSPSTVSIYSMWIRLSLRGMDQNEIESLMRNMDPAAIVQVKERLRRTIISNLETKRVRERFLGSRDSDDLKSLYTSIDTELRFAGLQHDEEIKLMIRDRFGVPFGQL